MARNLSPITKQSRREGYALHPKAHKIMVKKSGLPGQNARGHYRSKSSQFSIQLREKQKVKRVYGLMEKQFKTVMNEAGKATGKSGEVLLKLLEQRLDNVIYRAGFAVSRQAARQLVNHGHFLVDGKKIDIPSYKVSAGQVITVKNKSQKSGYFTNLEQITASVERPQLSWLKADIKKMVINITGEPKREEAEGSISEQLIVEFYSR